MKTLQLLSVVLGLVLAGCNRDVAEREARETADELRTAAAAAGERLADSWLTTKVQAQFFADDDIKARRIDVTTRDGVVTLRGSVESDQVRRLATQIARNTDGVREVQDQLAVGQPGTASTPASSAVATTGSAPDAVRPPETAAAQGVTNDQRIVTNIQAKYFLDESVKSRDIDVESRNGVVTVRGRVGSDSERAQALILARMADGVQRVEDGLTVDASLAPPETIGTAGTTAEQGSVTTPTPPSADGSLETSLRQRLSSDTTLADSQIEVSVKDGVVLVQGTVADQTSKQRVLTMVRQAEGVVQVVDRLSVAGRR